MPHPECNPTNPMINILAEHLDESKEIFKDEGIEITPIVEDVILSAIATGFRHAAGLLEAIIQHNEGMTPKEMANEAKNRLSQLVIACAEATNGMDRDSFRALVKMEAMLRMDDDDEMRKVMVEMLERMAEEAKNG